MTARERSRAREVAATLGRWCEQGDIRTECDFCERVIDAAYDRALHWTTTEEAT